MITTEKNLTCNQCGSSNVEQKEGGLYCASCDKIVKTDRAVHHEGFPHVVADESEQEQ